MGAEHPLAPYFGCCGTQEQQRNASMMDGGQNTTMTREDLLWRNNDKVTKIQAHMRGVVVRIKYLKLRNAHRQKQRHFQIKNTLEVTSKTNKFDHNIWRIENEEELKSKLQEESKDFSTIGVNYVGQWIGPFRQGTGQMTFEDGATYTGTWDTGMAKGQGVMNFAKNGKISEIYDGEWHDNMRHGKGTLTHMNGDKQTGQWFKDVQDGVGVERSEGADFKGNYQNGKKQGYGQQVWPDGTIYEGNWEDNVIKGFGIYTWPDGRVYTGEYDREKIHGFGYYKYPDGKSYTGFFVRNKRQGYGIYITPDKGTYSGSWHNGKQHGFGVVSYPNDSSKEAKWGLYYQGERIMRFTAQQASEIQKGEINPTTLEVKVDDPEQFWNDVIVLANKFEALSNFAREEAYHQLRQDTKDSRKTALNNICRQLDIE